jgi:hypothetical protein
MVTRSLCLLFLLALSASAQTPHIPPPESVNRNGLVGRWLVPGYQTGNGPTPTQVRDASGNSNHGTTVNSPNYGVIYLRPSMTFTGSAQYVTLGNPSALNITAPPMTLCAWIRRSDASNNPRDILGHGNQGYVWYLANGKLVLGKQNVSGSAIGTRVIADNAWHHVVTVYSGSVVYHYVDGVLDSSPSFSKTFSNGNNLYLGADSTQGEYFVGNINDVRIYNRALTADEIKRIYRGVQ